MKFVEAAAAYNAGEFGQKYPESQFQIHLESSRAYATWMTGQNYQGSGYYGSYPPAFLKRMRSMFDLDLSLLHLFSGSIRSGAYGARTEVTFDINPALEPDVVGDALQLGSYFESNSFDLILADTPYSDDDARRYAQQYRGIEGPELEKVKMPSRKLVIQECFKVLKPGGFLVWMDTVHPMYRKKEFDLVGLISIVRSTNHRYRGCPVFQKVL